MACVDDLRHPAPWLDDFDTHLTAQIGDTRTGFSDRDNLHIMRLAFLYDSTVYRAFLRAAEDDRRRCVK